MNRPFIITFISGAVLILIFALYKTVMADDNSLRSDFLTPPPPSVFAQPISDTVAYKLFSDYHQSNNEKDSKGVLRTGDKAIVQFYVDQEQLIEPLKAKALALGKEFLGLSAIPAYNLADSSHTLIWVAVVDADSTAGVKRELMLPKSGERWSDYIYDYTLACPEMCVENSNWLWNTNWVE
ncbi:hypothetical protein G3O08_09040 [Cryomorpha ignava]|uniref:Uncharacterized protein n=1 Tax=Cryomorpha ignava TaxID=101383 RepID=A0A7K3WQ16_9FLAO|nr:hypothetical protein [Cryomorpha ignava]NEN23646.1 hypothetical protein [Cryomorpha ignava]